MRSHWEKIHKATEKRENALTVPDKHALRIARDTMRMHCAAARILGQDHNQAADTIFRLTGIVVGIDSDCTCRRQNYRYYGLSEE